MSTPIPKLNKETKGLRLFHLFTTSRCAASWLRHPHQRTRYQPNRRILLG